MAKEPLEGVNADELIGKVLDGRYKVESLLGVGGFGMVFKGLQTSVQRPVAIKTLRPQLAMAPGFFERFKREAEIASRLHHPNIITIFDFGRTSDNLCYYAMEMLEGESLRQRIKRDGPFTLRQAAAVIEQSCAGVAHAHHAQVIHRDLKPHNIMLTSVDGHEYVKVLDFGLVKALEQEEEEEQLTSTGQVLGTPQYMPPEQAGGEVVDQRSDLFSLTGVFYYCLTGHSPYGANTVGKALTLALAGNLPPVATHRKGAPVPKSIDEFMLRGLMPAKEDRFQTAEEFVQTLHAALSGAPDSVLDAVPVFEPEVGESSTGPSSALRKSASRSRTSSKGLSAVSKPLPKSTSRIEPAPGAAPVVDRKQPSQASGSGSGSRSQVPQQGIPLGVLVAAVAAVVIIIGAAVAWKQLSKPESVPTPMLETPTVATKAPVIETPDAPAKVEPVATVKVTINTTPVGAEVSEEGVTIGNAPLIIDWPRGATRTLTFKLAGYKELSKTVRSEAAQSFDFPLEPARSKPVDGSKKPPTKNTPEMGAFD